MNERNRRRLGAAALAVSSIGFVLVFAWLAAHFRYPAILDRPASEVLPALSAGGAALRAAWTVYALLPLGLVVAARALPGGRITRAAGVLAGLCMTIGLARWPTLHVALADAFERGDVVEATFRTSNFVLGRIVGELAGELFLAAWLVGIARCTRRMGRHVVAAATLLLAVLMFVGAFRNVVPATAVATSVTNNLLPLVLLAIAFAWWRGASPLRAGAVIAVASIALFAPSSAHADHPRELMVHGFRAPSTGVELRDGFIGLHVGIYPTTIDKNEKSETRTTWFLKTGVTAYFLGFDAGSGRDSDFYAGVSLVQGLNGAWDVSKSAREGTGFVFESGFRWAAYRSIDLRLGGALLVSGDGRVRVNPTPGVSWVVPL